MNSLLAYHDEENAHVYAWDDDTAFVKLSGFCLTLVPLNGEQHEGDTPDKYRNFATLFLEAPALKSMETTFGELSTWANRRASKPLVQHCECSCGECSCEPCGRLPDRQHVLGHIFDRLIIRESLQWLYEANAETDAPLHMRVVGSPVAPGVPLNEKHPILIMTCGVWTGCVMCCRPDSLAGKDPLGDS